MCISVCFTAYQVSTDKGVLEQGRICSHGKQILSFSQIGFTVASPEDASFPLRVHNARKISSLRPCVSSLFRKGFYSK